MKPSLRPAAREFSCLVHVDEISSMPKRLSLEPSELERKSIADRLGIISLDSINAWAEYSMESGHIVYVHGGFTANVTQECVVTLEPIQNTVTDQFEGWYSDQEHIASFKKAQHEASKQKEFVEMPMLEEKDDPEPLENGFIDVGELMVQYLSLAIDHYPHKEGVSVQDKINESPSKNKGIVSETSNRLVKNNPFAALKNWRPKD